MEEIWKDIKGYEGLYQVSNLGRIKSITFRNNICKKNREKIIKITTNKQKRQYVMLYKNGKRKNFILHRLVAKAFIPNPKKLPEVNHIDGNPENNNICNLEWCTKSYNSWHAYHTGLSKYIKRHNECTKKPIIRSDKKVYDCAYSAAKELNVNVSSVRSVLKNRTRTCKGYKFEYLNK